MIEVLTLSLVPLLWGSLMMVRVWKGEERPLRLLMGPPFSTRKGYEVARVAAMVTLMWCGTFFIGGVVALAWGDRAHSNLRTALAVLGESLLGLSALAFLLAGAVLVCWAS